MSEANESVNYRIEKRGRNEWIVRRVDEDKKLLEHYRIVRIDASLELGYECECGSSDQRGSMCRHRAPSTMKLSSDAFSSQGCDTSCQLETRQA